MRDRVASVAIFLALLLSPVQGEAQTLGELHRMLPMDTGANAVALGDLDGDGDLDAMVALLVPWVFTRVYLNDGSGVFGEAFPGPPFPGATTLAVALGDVDGDGDLDAWRGNFGEDDLLLNDGSGTFTDATAQLPAIVDDTTAIALGDVDGDGDLDALMGNRAFLASAQDRLYLNDGTGVYADATAQLPGILDTTNAVALGDEDGDGDLDAFMGNGYPFSDAQDRLYLNDGSGVFSDATSQVPAILDNTTSIALGDLDGDADLDVLAGNSGQTRLYLNDGSGVFSDGTSQLPPATGSTQVVVLGDVDGDGDLDALAGNFGQNRLYLNGGSGVFTDASTQLPGMPEDTDDAALGDLDGDLDAWIGDAGQNRLYLNDGSGSFADPASLLPAITDPTYAVALGDLDGDGDLDALVGNLASAEPDRLYRNDGPGVFTDATAQLPAVADFTYAVALGDLDGDADLDVLLGNFGQERLYVNNGSGVFTDGTSQLPLFPDDTRAVALGDVDGDGDPDAWLGNTSCNSSGCPGAQDRLLLNDGSGVFSDGTSQLPAFLDDTRAVALGDVDGDGDLDAWSGNATCPSTFACVGAQDRLLLNDGSGGFADATSQLPAFLDDTRAVALGDVDGDGDLDALAGNYYPSLNRLYLNNGSGVFAYAPSQLPAASFLVESSAVALSDLDGDADLDALVANYAGGLLLFLNNGSGAFSAPVVSAVPGSTRALAPGDLDGDGDLDCWIGHGLLDRVLLNLGRQLAWTRIPRIRKPLTMDVYGPPGGTWALGVSLASANASIPPVGTLRLDPPSVFAVFTGSLDPQGRASISFLVPPNPSLVGLSVYWQGLVANPLRFTNLEIATLTSL